MMFLSLQKSSENENVTTGNRIRNDYNYETKNIKLEMFLCLFFKLGVKRFQNIFVVCDTKYH